MAKYEVNFHGDVQDFESYIHEKIMNSSMSIEFADSSEVNTKETNLYIRVYERYSFTGGSRVSLNLTILNYDQNIYVSAISTGSSRAVLFKINTIGEEVFLEECVHFIEKYISK